MLISMRAHETAFRPSAAAWIPHVLPAANPFRCRPNRRGPVKCAARKPGAAFDVVIIGGGAAGFFAAVTIVEQVSNAKVTILESLNSVLTKVRISGGGRCNVTNGIHHDDPLSFASNYPRGEREVTGVLSRFGAREVMEFFENEGVKLKIEDSGKVFPQSNQSEDVINALVQGAKGVEIRTGCRVIGVRREESNRFEVLMKGESVYGQCVVIATGGSGGAGVVWAKELGHKIVKQVPSLFSFKIEDEDLVQLAGISVEQCGIRLVNKKVQPQRGSILITHWGLSGPCVLSLSAFGARVMAENKYKVEIEVDWVEDMDRAEKKQILEQARRKWGGRLVGNYCPFKLPKRLWKYLSAKASGKKWGEVQAADVEYLATRVGKWRAQVQGRGAFKDEFVTAGGVALSEVCLKTFESKTVRGLFFAGEVLDVDGRTGGFNLEFAWSSGWGAAMGVARRLESLT